MGRAKPATTQQLEATEKRFYIRSGDRKRPIGPCGLAHDPQPFRSLDIPRVKNQSEFKPRNPYKGAVACTDWQCYVESYLT